MMGRRRKMLAEFFSELGKRGAEARAKLPPEQRQAIARKAAKTRWRKVRRVNRAARLNRKRDA